ncbi:hypothetical protein C7413_12680 [Paraburkholderia silvatlantica]|nr:hypothetical protein C7411_12780 [Paraburkholderia silvatlantica]PXW31187.1 hypothetical protein C7413_12680 [Paraburkholderia silvatlantica]
MRVNPVPHVCPVHHPLPRHRFDRAGPHQLTQQAVDAGKLLTGFRQHTHLVLSKLRLTRQLRANQRYDPAVTTQARCRRPLFYGRQLGRCQANLDAGTWFANNGAAQVTNDHDGSRSRIIVDGSHDQPARAFACRQTAARAPVVPMQSDCTEFDAQTLARGHDPPQRDGDIGAGPAGSRSISGAGARSGAARLR